ncbi:MAG: hypothetical protein A3F12_01160 [Gammaproteobacteria bacterium RIFCSPHIGHO2_12_FULL_38_14]|nr:MAG: hypothetical protein A3F12_01160 [Gammaproteobacteria bacterium RIFCSPHIGHO2_12_FULL_38_14]
MDARAKYARYLNEIRADAFNLSQQIITSPTLFIYSLEWVIQTLNSIPGKVQSPWDFRLLSNSYYRLANCYFNKGEYDRAIEQYLNAIHSLENLYQSEECGDDDHRNCIKICIDLSDTYTELKNIEAAACAFENAIHAYDRIKDKTADERDNDPHKNPTKFQNYFEGMLSDIDYFRCDTFKVNQTLLNQVHEERKNDINHLLENMGLENKFTPLPQNKQSISDQNYRLTAERYCKIAQNEVDRDKYNLAINAFQRAIEALNLIRLKEPLDVANIQEINNIIQTIKANEKSKNTIDSLAKFNLHSSSVEPPQDNMEIESTTLSYHQ